MSLEQDELKKLFTCQGDGFVSQQFFLAAKKVERGWRGAGQVRREFSCLDFFETVLYNVGKRWLDIGNGCTTIIFVDGGERIHIPAEVQNDDGDFRVAIIVGIKRSRLRSYSEERDGNNKQRSRD